MDAIIISRGGRTPPSQNTPTPFDEFKTGLRIISPQQLESAFLINVVPLVPPVGSPQCGTSDAASRPSSRSSRQSNSSPPTPSRNRRGACHHSHRPVTNSGENSVSHLAHTRCCFLQVKSSGKPGTLQGDRTHILQSWHEWELGGREHRIVLVVETDLEMRPEAGDFHATLMDEVREAWIAECRHHLAQSGRDRSRAKLTTEIAKRASTSTAFPVADGCFTAIQASADRGAQDIADRRGHNTERASDS